MFHGLANDGYETSQKVIDLIRLEETLKELDNDGFYQS